MNTNNICAKTDELILEFEVCNDREVRNSFNSLRDLLNIANHLLDKTECFSFVKLINRTIVRIDIVNYIDPNYSLTISASVKEPADAEIIQLSKFNFASAFHCKSRIEFIDSGQTKIRLRLKLPTDNESISSENIAYQFKLFDEVVSRSK